MYIIQIKIGAFNYYLNIVGNRVQIEGLVGNAKLFRDKQEAYDFANAEIKGDYNVILRIKNRSYVKNGR